MRGVSYIARTTATVSDIPELDTDRNPILNFSPDLNYTGLFTGYGHRCGISNELCDTLRDREQRALGGSFEGRVRDWTPTFGALDAAGISCVLPSPASHVDMRLLKARECVLV